MQCKLKGLPNFLKTSFKSTATVITADYSAMVNTYHFQK